VRETKQQQLAAKYWKEASEFVRRSSSDPKDPDWCVLERDSGEKLERWRRYLVARLGFLPAGFRMMEDGKINSFLVPTETPDMFDTMALRVT
jgi:hypothetical protein